MDMNQSRAAKYFTLTIGMLLVMMHTAIHSNCKPITTVTGCRQTRASMTCFSNPNFNKNSSMSATMSGSVGKLMPMPPRSNCSRLIESGVAKTMKSSNRSAAATSAQATSATTGSSTSQGTSFAKSTPFTSRNSTQAIGIQWSRRIRTISVQIGCSRPSSAGSRRTTRRKQSKLAESTETSTINQRTG